MILPITKIIDKRLPKKCFPKFVMTVLNADPRFYNFVNWLQKYPKAIEQSARSYDAMISDLSHDRTKYHSSTSTANSIWSIPSAPRKVLEEASLAYLEYRMYFSQ